MAKRRKSGLYRKGALLNTIRAKYQTRKAEVQRKKKEEAANKLSAKREIERKQRIDKLKKLRKKADEPLIKRKNPGGPVKATPTFIFIKHYWSMISRLECRENSVPFSDSLKLEYATSPALDNAAFWLSRIGNNGCFVDERFDYNKDNLSLISSIIYNQCTQNLF